MEGDLSGVSARIKKTIKKKKFNWADFVEQWMNLILTVFMVIMFVFFPLFYKNQYEEIGESKYQLFYWTSLTCLMILFLLLIIWFVIKARVIIKGAYRFQISGTDNWMLFYLLTIFLSFALSDFKSDALKGASGWNMGLYSQLIFVAIYFFVSRFWIQSRNILYAHFLASSLVFLLGILHRFQIDPLGMYNGLSQKQMVEFLSTMGQATWYSSYVCTVIPLGLIFFFLGTKKITRFWAGIYSVLGMATLVTQNSDSAYLALLCILFGMFYFAFDSEGYWKRFLETLLLIFGTFKVVGILQQLFASKIIPLEKLSLFMSQSVTTWLVLIFIICLYLLSYTKFTWRTFREEYGHFFWKGLLTLSLVWLVMVVVFIYLNTTGFLSTHFGYSSSNNYLFFDKYWGNGRGSIWSFTAYSFSNLPLIKKVVGIGPDCFAFFNYSIPEYAAYLRNMWGTNTTLTNAHNEFLNTLFCYGVLGLVAYVGMLVSATKTSFQNRAKNPILIGFGLCLIAYMGHNIFCYQQVCCTPFLFFFLGMAENLKRSKQSFILES